MPRKKIKSAKAKPAKTKAPKPYRSTLKAKPKSSRARAITIDHDGYKPEREADGRLKKGFSLNPSGRPAIAKELRAYAQSFSFEAIDVLVSIMRDKKSAKRDRAWCADKVLDRAIGKAPIAITPGAGEDGREATWLDVMIAARDAAMDRAGSAASDVAAAVVLPGLEDDERQPSTDGATTP